MALATWRRRPASPAMSMLAILSRLKQAAQPTATFRGPSDDFIFEAASRFLAGSAAASSGSLLWAAVEPQQIQPGISGSSSPSVLATASVDSW